MRFIETQTASATPGGVRNGRNVQQPTRPSMPRKASQIDMLDGVVEMDSLNQILALDDSDPTKEFSRTLVWAWCDQAAHAVEEMQRFLEVNNMELTAQKAHYLKGSSASLGLTKVHLTCQSIYLLHYPPTLAQIREMYSSGSSDSTSNHAYDVSAASSTSNTPSLISGASYSPAEVDQLEGPFPPSHSPTWDKFTMDFDTDKIRRARVLLLRLKAEIQEANDWLRQYYAASDKYEGIVPIPWST